jgi:hypothetical protein
MPDRYSDPDRSLDSRESRAGPIDSCDYRANSPMVSGLMLAAAVVILVLASAM